MQQPSQHAHAPLLRHIPTHAGREAMWIMSPGWLSLETCTRSPQRSDPYPEQLEEPDRAPWLTRARTIFLIPFWCPGTAPAILKSWKTYYQVPEPPSKFSTLAQSSGFSSAKIRVTRRESLVPGPFVSIYCPFRASGNAQAAAAGHGDADLPT